MSLDRGFHNHREGAVFRFPKSEWAFRGLVFVLLAALEFGSLFFGFTFYESQVAHLAFLSFAALILVLGFRLLIHVGVSENRVRLAVMTTTGAVCLAVVRGGGQIAESLRPSANALIDLVNKTLGGSLPPLGPFANGLSTADTALVLAALVAVAWLVLRSLRQQPSAMGRPEADIRTVLPAVTNFDRLKIVKESLRNRLDMLDRDTRWSDSLYVPLQAEVQILEGRSTARKIVELLTALRNDQRSRVFVVLGEPGSGKSVALRKLARDLLANSGQSDRIPVYLNLKEWRTERKWTPDAPPTTEDFHSFVYYNILQSLDFASQSFLRENDNYRHLREAGYFFFILDSFDEIPAVLDHDDNSWLISALSDCIVQYMTGGKEARGVIASRLFRKPRIVHHQRTLYELRPFSEDRVVRAIKLAANQPERLTRLVMTERPDLGTIARNPFLLHLVINHWNRKGQAPQAQAEMFETFIAENLALARASFAFKGMDDAELYRTCEDIAAVMFNHPEVGLEIGELELAGTVPADRLKPVLVFLRQARIGRLNELSGAFSFVHRRFNEYFLVRRLKSGRDPIPYDAIQTDSRWRDALVLFAEIAPPEQAATLAAHAWTFARNIGRLSLTDDLAGFIQARHALRFLIEGFRNRTEVLAPYHDQLAAIVRAKIDGGGDLIETKTALEAIGLIPVEKSQDLICDILERFPGWIGENAMASARYLRSVDLRLLRLIHKSISQRPGFFRPFQTHREQQILSLSEPLRPVTKWLRGDKFGAASTLCFAIFCILYGVFVDYYFGVSLLNASLSITTTLLIGSLVGEIMASKKKVPVRSENNFPPSIVSISMVAINVIVVSITSLLDFAYGCKVKNIEFPWHLIEVDYSITSDRCNAYPTIAAIGLASVTFWTHVSHIDSAIFTRTFWKETYDHTIHLAKTMIAISSVLTIIYIASAHIVLPAIAYAASMLLDMPGDLVSQAIIDIAKYIFGTLVVAIACICFKLYYVDNSALRIVRKGFVAERATIAIKFQSFKTQSFRLRYVNWLERESVHHLEALRDPSNTCPDGKRPQIADDPASMKLAQLDARWRGLD